jgi:hypothetical protein
MYPLVKSVELKTRRQRLVVKRKIKNSRKVEERRAMNETTVTETVNKLINILNKEDKISEEEVVTILAQLLIKTGKALYDPQDNLSKIDWVALNREYYMSKESNIGLGLLLNGGQMMGAVNTKTIAKTNTEKTNDKISTGTKSTQKISRTTVPANATKRRTGRRKGHN